MYEQCFNLNARPFTSTPYVEHYFASESMQQSLASARLSVERGNGPVIVIGDVGTGKSLLLAMLEDEYRTQFNVANVAHSSLGERRELLQSILFELNLPYKDMDEGELRLSLMDYLKPSTACPNGVLLLVDEADQMPVELLDEIRLITNYVSEGQPRVRLVMAGSQRLEDKLNDPKLVSFNQRLAARCYLSRLSRQETGDYVTTHVDRAGGNGKQLFSASSLIAIHEVADGCPRYVNQVCDHAMILAATRGQDAVDDQLVHEAWADVQSLPGMAPQATSSSQTTGNSIAENLESDENWTVIEFGSLDDEPTSDTTSVYDFNATVESDDASEPGLPSETESNQPSTEVNTDDHEEYRLEPEEVRGHVAAGDVNHLADGLDSLAATHAAEISRLVSQIDFSESETTDEPTHHLQPIDRRSEALEEPRQEQQGEDLSGADSSIESVEANSPVGNGERVMTAGPSEPVANCDNPFDEEFEDEEVVQYAYTAQVATQNQSSLDLTADHIALIQPIDEELTNEQAVELGSDEFESPSDVDQVSSQVCDEPSAVESELGSCESEVDSLTEGVVESDCEGTVEVVAEQQGSGGEDEISRKAEEILKTIHFDQEPVSCETDSIESSPIVSEQVATSTGIDSFAMEKDSEEDDALEESQLLLQQIIKENNERAAAIHPDPKLDSLSIKSSESLPADSIPYPSNSVPDDEPITTEHALVDPSTEAVEDDRDMLIVSRQDQPAKPKSIEDDPIPFPATPLSTGQAKRMDYQQLFDQLRNIAGT